jgi:hypothetical protein
MPPRSAPAGIFNQTPVIRGRGEARFGANIINVTRNQPLTRNRAALNDLSQVELRERRDQLVGAWRDAIRGNRADPALRTRYNEEFRDLPVAAYSSPDNPNPRNYDTIIPDAGEIEIYFLDEVILGSNNRMAWINNPQIQGGRFRVEIELIPPMNAAGRPAGRLTRSFELTIPGGLTRQQLSRFVDNNPQLQWALREDSDQILPFYSIRIFPVFSFTGGRRPALNRLLDGKGTHCVLDPIRNYLDYKTVEFQGKDTGTRYLRKLEIVDQFVQKYSEGIDVDGIKELSSKIGIRVILKDINDAILLDTGVLKKTLALQSCFEFVYHDCNHVTRENDEDIRATIDDIIETGVYDELIHQLNAFRKKKTYCSLENIVKVRNYKDHVKYVSERTLSLILDFLQKNRIYHYYFVTQTAGVTFLQVAGIQIHVEGDKFSSAVKEFTDTTFKDMYIDIKTPVYEFVRRSYVQKIQFSYQTTKGMRSDDFDEVDIEKAYTQFERCPEYIGFPSIINCLVNMKGFSGDPFEFVRENVGFYQVRVIDAFNTDTTDSHMRHAIRIGIERDGVYTWPSPLILWMRRHFHIKIELLVGAWSSKPFRFQFSDEIKNLKREGISAYALITGRLATEPYYTHKYMYTSQKMLEEVNDARDNVHYQFVNNGQDEPYGTMIQSLENICPRNKLHISSFILSYCFQNVFEEVLKHDASDIYAIKVDSILLTRGKYVGDTTVFKHVREKGKIPKMLPNPIVNPYFEAEDLFDTTNLLTFDKYIRPGFVLGPGGCGKTYHFLSNRDTYPGLCYTTLCNRTIVEKRKEARTLYHIPINAFNVYRLTGEKCEDFKRAFPLVRISNILIDEATMVEEKFLGKVKEAFPYANVYICGDFSRIIGSFQCKIDSKKCISLTPTDIVSYEFNQDRRSINDETKLVKKNLRDLMERERGFFKFEAFTKFCKSQFKSISSDDLLLEYSPGDYVITYENAVKDRINQQLIGFGNPPFYIITKTDWAKGVCNGDVVLEKPADGVQYEETVAFTSHKIQGSTIRPPTKVFIVANDVCRDRTVLYTAVSRVQCKSQIVMVWEEETMVDGRTGLRKRPRLG